jgi:hypothetical protein
LIAQPPYPPSPVAAVEDFEFHRVAQCLHPMRQIRRNADDRAGGDPHLVLVIASEPESQRVFDACAKCSISSAWRGAALPFLKQISPNATLLLVMICRVIVSFVRWQA